MHEVPLWCHTLRCRFTKVSKNFSSTYFCVPGRPWCETGIAVVLNIRYKNNGNTLLMHLISNTFMLCVQNDPNICHVILELQKYWSWNCCLLAAFHFSEHRKILVSLFERVQKNWLEIAGSYIRKSKFIISLVKSLWLSMQPYSHAMVLPF